MKLKKGDEIKVVIGKDKGKVGKIELVLTKSNKVVIPGVNEYKRHQKGRMQGQRSEIITITKPLPVSNVALICPKCKKLTRVGYKIDEKLAKGQSSSGRKVRICRKCGKELN